MSDSTGAEAGALRKGPWTPEEDELLVKCIAEQGEGNWTSVPKKAGEGNTASLQCFVQCLVCAQESRLGQYSV